MKPKVALTKGANRSENIDKALRLIEKDIDLTRKSNLFIKVNFVLTDNQLAATHVDGVRTLLKFLRERYNGNITIGESTLGPVSKGFENYGYLDLVKEFDVELVDLNDGECEMFELYNSELQPMKVHFSRQLLASDYLISIGPSKTHDFVVVTLSIKNVIMGGVSFNHDDKIKIHQGHPVMNLNLYLMASRCLPRLSIIDGYTGMEGEGPGIGDPVNWGIAVASCSAVAADCLTASLMGFDISDIGYLWYLQKKGYGIGDISQMDIIGENPEQCRHSFKPHPEFSRQKQWRDERINKIMNL
ncbi:DUF362 domain-containing protein [Chloroflexota bacterium]